MSFEPSSSSMAVSMSSTQVANLVQSQVLRGASCLGQNTYRSRICPDAWHPESAVRR